MISTERQYTFRIGLRNIAYLRFSTHSEYNSIVSPYMRIYLITEGNGQLLTGDQHIELDSGFMYLIPGFVHCSYAFNKDLAHIYIHFEASMEKGLSINHLFTFQSKIPATELNKLLFYRLLDLNPGLELPHHDPHVYQTKPWIDIKPSWVSVSQKLETEAIIQQLLACFITDIPGTDIISNLKYNIEQILSYIHENLHTDINMEQLAEIACLSKDHFTRIFKSVLGVPPSEFIIRKRIEKSQFLLLTSELSISQIVDETNFKSAPYFSRMFKKYTKLTPGEYRKNRFKGI